MHSPVRRKRLYESGILARPDHQAAWFSPEGAGLFHDWLATVPCRRPIDDAGKFASGGPTVAADRRERRKPPRCPESESRDPAGTVDPRHEECVGECDISATGVGRISYRSAAHIT